MDRIILYFFYIFFLSMFYSSYIFAAESADFEDNTFGSSYEYETVADVSYDEAAANQHPKLLAENTSVDVDRHDGYGSHRVHTKKKHSYSRESSSYFSRLPHYMDGYHEKVIVVNPRKHVWGAYSADGQLLRAGLATAGSSWCPDIHRACRTRSGTFRIYTLGSRSCYSKRYPVGRGGAPMPYCMFFNGNQGLHGSHEIAEANLSHGCVRISVSDAEWVRFNFATIGTKVIVTSY